MGADAVRVDAPEPGIVTITMQDTVHKNGFSPALIDGLNSAFAWVKSQPACKVVMLTGYGPYFASGGTQESLLSLSAGEGVFSDAPLYELPLQCEVPVVSAMQGHAIGGGLVLGMFADFAVLGVESIYTANFMKYGFTPGFGSTCVLAHKLGMSLAHEMLLTANTYRGEDLARRGVSFPVLPRAQVVEHAMGIARAVAQKPRVSLVVLKRHLTELLRTQLPVAAGKEVEMHRLTLHLPEVRGQIERMFGA